MSGFMNSPKIFLLLCLMILFDRGQAAHPCSSSTYAQNSTFQENLDRLLSSLSSNANHSDGVYNTTVLGQGDNSNATVYGRLQCLRDATVESCQKCVSDGINDMLQKCPNNTEAFGWYDQCYLRYSEEYFFTEMEEDPRTILVNTGNATDTTSFMKLLGETLRVVTAEAPEGGSKKFATKTQDYDAFQTLYSARRIYLRFIVSTVSEQVLAICLVAAMEM